MWSAFTVTGTALKISLPFTFTTWSPRSTPGRFCGFCDVNKQLAQMCLPIEIERERERDGVKDVKECVVVAAVI